jgi:hypothetical protein
LWRAAKRIKKRAAVAYSDACRRKKEPQFQTSRPPPNAVAVLAPKKTEPQQTGRPDLESSTPKPAGALGRRRGRRLAAAAFGSPCTAGRTGARVLAVARAAVLAPALLLQYLRGALFRSPARMHTLLQNPTKARRRGPVKGREGRGHPEHNPNRRDQIKRRC